MYSIEVISKKNATRVIASLSGGGDDDGSDSNSTFIWHQRKFKSPMDFALFCFLFLLQRSIEWFIKAIEPNIAVITMKCTHFVQLVSVLFYSVLCTVHGIYIHISHHANRMNDHRSEKEGVYKMMLFLTFEFWRWIRTLFLFQFLFFFFFFFFVFFFF